jgi:hypothetical protein
MKTLGIAFSVVLVFNAFAAGTANNEAHDVSIVRLIASPQDYARKLVRVVGYVSIGFEGDAIYLHEEDFKRSLTTNALWLQAKPEMMKELSKLSRQYIVLEGVFDPSDAGHLGLFSGTIRDITRADSWPQRTATVSPTQP